MLPHVAGRIGGKDLKFYFIDSLGKGCFSFKPARTSGISQDKFFRNLFSVNPLSPDFKLIRIPETSGSERATSKHPHFCLDQDLLSLLLVLIWSRIEDVYDQAFQLDQDPFSDDILSWNKSEGLRTLLNGVRIG